MSQYQTLDKDGVHLATCPASIDGDDPKAMESLTKNWLLSSSRLHILDFKDVATVKPNAYRTFVLYNQALKANNKMLFVINLSSELLQQFKQDGLTNVFVAVSSIEEAKKRATPPKANVDVEFINPFIQAARSVLETQAQIKITPGRPTLKKPGEAIPMEIAGVIAISCKEFTGSINLCFRAEVFLKIYESLTGEQHTTLTTEIEDAAAELLNMIFGQAKTTLNDLEGYTLDRAMPAVLTGEKLKLSHKSRGPVIVIPFESPAGLFHLEVVIEHSVP